MFVNTSHPYLISVLYEWIQSRCLFKGVVKHIVGIDKIKKRKH